VDVTATRTPTTPARVHAVTDGLVLERPDRLVTEEPMEIRVHLPGGGPQSLAVTMRTPGNDFELAVGFCVTEGVVHSPDDVASVAYCVERGAQHYNIVTVQLRVAPPDGLPQRAFVANASCGLCGKTALEDVELRCPPIAHGPRVAASTILTLPDRLREAQRVFDSTGGLHGAALFRVDGALDTLREDVGRHNAVDKVVGRATLDRRLPLASGVLMVSGRVSFEIVQKAAMAGIPIVCAVSAPSSLAVDAARRVGQTVVGFVRTGRFNVYTGRERVDLDA
jgi:FdhD protein